MKTRKVRRVSRKRETRVWKTRPWKTISPAATRKKRKRRDPDKFSSRCGDVEAFWPFAASGYRLFVRIVVIGGGRGILAYPSNNNTNMIYAGYAGYAPHARTHARRFVDFQASCCILRSIVIKVSSSLSTRF